jgi:hypothetical protein
MYRGPAAVHRYNARVNVTISELAANSDGIARISSLLHDSIIREPGALQERTFSLCLGRIGYEIGRELDRHWLLGQRWFYPWIECELTVSDVDAIEEGRQLDGGDLDDNLHAIHLRNGFLTLGRMFGDTRLRISPSSTLHVRDTGTEPDHARGLTLHGKAFDLSAIADLLSSDPRA